MKKHNWKDVLLGALCAIMLFSLGMPAYAALTARKIDVYSGITIYKDDQLFVPRDVNGNAVEVFAHNGTTYLPVRAISEMLGQTVQWEGKEQAVYIGKHSSDKPAVLLQDLDYFMGEDLEVFTSKTDNLNVSHSEVFGCNDLANTYLLNGQYTKLTGTLFQVYNARSSTYVTTVKFYGDGDLLKTLQVSGGVLPIDYEVDVTGILELKIVIEAGGYWYDGWRYDRSAYMTCGLYT
ncbi:MAG: copper amine oxidase [Clostridia bacterium]|nr:copper amine oxidase [Clostridia bacterium]